MRYKILLIMPSLAGGGAEKIMSLLLKYLNREIFEPSLVLLNKEGTYLDEIPEDVTIIDLNKRGRMDFFRLVAQLAKHIAREAPSLIVSSLTYTNYLTLLSRFLSGKSIPVILSDQNTLSILLKHERLYPLKKIIIKLLYPHADRIIANSEGVKEDLLNFLPLDPDKILLIYNSIDIATIDKLTKEEVEHPWFQDEIPVLIACGRLTRQKNYPLLIKTFAKVQEATRAKLLILGEGEELRALEKLACTLGVRDKVSFLGFQKNPFKFMARGTIFVLSSSWEGFANVIIEAIACGVPVISTDCPSGPAELITDGVNGILVRVENRDALSKAILRLLRDEPLRKQLAEAGRKRADDFRLEKMVSEYERVFLEILEVGF
jgi:glycosyltransferase involved in cell wall biosynthesis